MKLNRSGSSNHGPVGYPLNRTRQGTAALEHSGGSNCSIAVYVAGTVEEQPVKTN